MWDFHNLEHKSQHEKWASGSPGARGTTAPEVEGTRGKPGLPQVSKSQAKSVCTLLFAGRGCYCSLFGMA